MRRQENDLKSYYSEMSTLYNLGSRRNFLSLNSLSSTRFQGLIRGERVFHIWGCCFPLPCRRSPFSTPAPPALDLPGRGLSGFRTRLACSRLPVFTAVVAGEEVQPRGPDSAAVGSWAGELHCPPSWSSPVARCCQTNSRFSPSSRRQASWGICVGCHPSGRVWWVCIYWHEKFPFLSKYIFFPCLNEETKFSPIPFLLHTVVTEGERTFLYYLTHLYVFWVFCNECFVMSIYYISNIIYLRERERESEHVFRHLSEYFLSLYFSEVEFLEVELLYLEGSWCIYCKINPQNGYSSLRSYYQ